MISIVVPLYNEEESILPFYEELKKVLLMLKNEYEIIFIDDGSTDKSLENLKALAKKDKDIKIFSFRRNRGKAEALNYGFIAAKGDYIITLDADLEDRPEEIPNLISKINEGYDLITGWRKNRKHAWFMKIPSRFFNFLSNSFWGLRLHDYNCGLKIYTKGAAKSLNLYGGLHRFIPLLLYKQGFKVAEIPVVHDKRRFGKSKYGFSKIWKDSPDMFTMLFLTKYGKRPLHFFSLIGFLFTLIGFSFISYLTFIHFAFNESVGQRPLLFMGMLFVISGFQVFFTGFLSDLIINRSEKRTINDESILKYSNDK